MKSYIFTKRELEILKSFLDKEVKLNGFRDLKYRISQHHERIREHFQLMEKAVEKLKAVS